MDYSNKDVMKLVREVLGDSPEWICASKESAYSDCTKEEDKIYRELNNCYYDIYLDYGFTHAILMDYDNLKDKNYYIHSGASKVVIVPYDKDYVIKVPITDLYEPNVEKREFQRFSTTSINPMEVEIEIFRNARGCFKKVLVPLIYVDNIGSIPVYIQEKYTKEAIEELYFDYIEEKINSGDKVFERAMSYFDEDWPINGVWAQSVIDTYKESAFEVFHGIANWPLERDLHESNYGFDSEDKPIIWDYAGYSNSEWWESA